MTATASKEALRQTNARLRSILQRWQLNPDDIGAMQPEVLNGVLAELQQMTALLGPEPGEISHDADWQRELAEYKAQVEQVEQCLPVIHGRLLVEKMRLERARSHLEAAQAWISGHEKTL